MKYSQRFLVEKAAQMRGKPVQPRVEIPVAVERCVHLGEKLIDAEGKPFTRLCGPG